MTRKTLCIVIALMVLSISAIGLSVHFDEEFQSELNGFPVKVTISGDLPFTASDMSVEELRANWRRHQGEIVTFTGRVADQDGNELIGTPAEKVTLEGYPFVEVYPLGAPDLPIEYQLRGEYRFTGFLMSYERHVPFEDRGARFLRVYAFKIRHLGETKSDSGESDLFPDEDANPKDGADSQGETK